MRTLRQLRLVVRIAWDADRRGILFVAGSMWGNDVAGALYPLAYKIIIDRMVAHRPFPAAVPAVLLAGALAVVWALGLVMFARTRIVEERVGFAVDHRILVAESGIPHV